MLYLYPIMYWQDAKLILKNLVGPLIQMKLLYCIFIIHGLRYVSYLILPKCRYFGADAKFSIMCGMYFTTTVPLWHQYSHTKLKHWLFNNVYKSITNLMLYIVNRLALYVFTRPIFHISLSLAYRANILCYCTSARGRSSTKTWMMDNPI